MSDSLREELREIVAEVAEVDEVPDGTAFSDLGIDSMMAIEIVAEVERKYSVSMPEEDLKDLTDLDRVFEKVSALVK